jgi:hypothetical protein
MCVCVDGHIFDWERSDGKAIDTTALVPSKNRLVSLITLDLASTHPRQNEELNPLLDMKERAVAAMKLAYRRKQDKPPNRTRKSVVTVIAMR